MFQGGWRLLPHRTRCHGPSILIRWRHPSVQSCSSASQWSPEENKSRDPWRSMPPFSKKAPLVVSPWEWKATYFVVVGHVEEGLRLQGLVEESNVAGAVGQREYQKLKHGRNTGEVFCSFTFYRNRTMLSIGRGTPFLKFLYKMSEIQYTDVVMDDVLHFENSSLLRLLALLTSYVVGESSFYIKEHSRYPRTNELTGEISCQGF